MANPVITDQNEAAAEALSATVDAGTGIKHQTLDADDTSNPSAFAQLMNLEHKIMKLLATTAQGAAIWLESGLNVGVYAVTFMIGTTEYVYAGDASTAMTASATNYLYLDSAGTLKVSTSAWPAGDHFKIAKITTDATQVTQVVDARRMNHMIGIINAWYDVIAAGDVSFGNNPLLGIGRVSADNPQVQTIDSAGAITIDQTNPVIDVDTYLAAATDDLDVITPSPTPAVTFIILKQAIAGRDVTVRSAQGGGGAIFLLRPDAVLDDPDKRIALMFWNGVWVELFRNWDSGGPRSSDIDFNGWDALNVGRLTMKASTERTIASGTASILQGYHTIDTEADAASDDLDTLTGGIENQLLYIMPADDARDVVVKHGMGGTGQFSLANGKDYTLKNVQAGLLCIYKSGVWCEVARTDRDLADLVGTSQAIPFPVSTCFYAGTVTNGLSTFNLIVTKPGFKLKRYRAYANTAPSGGSCVVRVEKNGASVHAADSEAVNILDGTNGDVSDTIDVDFVEGDRLTVHVITANAAGDLVISFDAYTAAKLPS